MIKSKQLKGEDWLLLALDTLDNEGIHNVNVEYLARQLGVTKGSFYWHFKNREMFLSEMLNYWRDILTTNVIERCAQDGADSKDTLLKLMTIITTEKVGRYEAAIRSFAAHNEMARSTLQEVDQQRFQFITGLFIDMGFQEPEAELRARLALYYQVAENSIFLKDSKKKRNDLVLQRFAFLTRK